MQNDTPTVNGSTAVAESPVQCRARPQKQPQEKQLPPYNVVLVDDQIHTYDYVVEMLQCVFGYQEVKGFALARKLDTWGRVIVYTTHKELAELKRDLITAYGPDVRMTTSNCGMNAFIEPAEAE